MAEPKTKKNSASVTAFLDTIQDEQKRRDSKELVKIFEETTKEKPAMWGTAIIGFGVWHYKSQRSSAKGDWPMVGFSPRKQSLTLYLSSDSKDYAKLLAKLGKHSTSKACLYIKRLSDIDTNVLRQLIKNSFEHMKEKYGS